MKLLAVTPLGRNRETSRLWIETRRLEALGLLLHNTKPSVARIGLRQTGPSLLRLIRATAAQDGSTVFVDGPFRHVAA